MVRGMRKSGGSCYVSVKISQRSFSAALICVKVVDDAYGRNVRGRKTAGRIMYTNGATRGGMIVLLAENQANKSATIRQTLEGLAMMERLILVSDGSEALAYLRGDGPYSDRSLYPFPNFVFLNSRLSGFSGIGALCCLRSERGFERLPVVIVSRSFSKAQEETAHGMRAACCLEASSSKEVMRALLQSVRFALRTDDVALPALLACA